ncbi:hypothetical protein BGZ76_001686 [Entomortierella beljakovae]|nr:hypothetical protein BGZ76_001686 [Entomortierella beljakovae]
MSHNSLKTLFNFILVAVLSLSVMLNGAYAQRWQTGTGMTPASYQSKFNSLTRSGYRLTHVDGFSIKNNNYMSGVWEKKSGPAWIAKHGLTSAQYQAEFTKLKNSGYRPKKINAYNINGGADRYAGIWEKVSGPAWVARHNLDAKAHQAAFNTYVKQGYRLKQVSGYTVKGALRYASLYEKSAGPAWYSRSGINAARFQTEFDARLKMGYRLVAIDAFTVGGVNLFGGIWEKSAGGFYAYANLTPAQFRARNTQFLGRGYHLVSAAGYGTGSPLYAALWSK